MERRGARSGAAVCLYSVDVSNSLYTSSVCNIITLIHELNQFQSPSKCASMYFILY